MGAPLSQEAEPLAAVFKGVDMHGQRYSKETLETVWAWVILAPGDAPPTPVEMGVLHRVGARAGVRKGDSPEKVQAALAKYFKEHPVPPTLLNDLSMALRGTAMNRQNAAGVGKAFAKFAGNTPQFTLDNDPPPPPGLFLKAGALAAANPKGPGPRKSPGPTPPTTVKP